MKNFAFIFSFAVMALLAFASPASAQGLHVTVDGGKVNPLPIAIPDFVSASGAPDEIGRNMTKVITDDLQRSGLFRPLNQSSFIQPAAAAAQKPNFGEWRTINAEALATGLLSKTPDGKTRVEFRLWDVFAQQQMVGTAYMTTPTNWRRIAHIIADAIYKRLTGENGYFDTRIVYISETGPGNARVKRLAIMDQDGHNHRFLTDGSALVLTPRFSPTMQQITYMAYYNNKPRVYLYDINSGRQSVLGDFPGMTFAPRFSPDGRKVVMSLSKNGNSDIYTMDLRSRNPQRVTNDASINTAPSFSPDGQRITFESDRSGKQQIYVMSANGGSAQRISFGEGRYASPVWSPRGDLIAFIKMSKGQFALGVMKPDGSGERIIKTAYHIEGPTWAPNGRVLAFFTEKPAGTSRKAELHSIDLTGFNDMVIDTPLGASDPAWSPLNP
ncbi:MAG TPA: Tol-Pal system beta propeller repeat protein TolB [Patescibacteria group bacterium]|nr:Tol-Pal system beta propeller repeat protein TolB [Patescibacteria group bacterium]